MGDAVIVVGLTIVWQNVRQERGLRCSMWLEQRLRKQVPVAVTRNREKIRSVQERFLLD